MQKRAPSIATLASGAVATLFASAALAQQAPDAGRTLRELAPPAIEAPRPSRGLSLEVPALQAVPPGGATVTLRGIRLEGHRVFSADTLLAQLGEFQGRELDLAGLQGLANTLSAYYRDQGYPFARALLPAQTMDDGVVHILVIEGRYGEVRATGDEVLTHRAQRFLQPLRSGDVIASAPLERATLLLEDLPGVVTTPVMRPGLATGTGDLVVDVQRGRRVEGDVVLDNHGNRYNGEYRAGVNLTLNSPFSTGDQLLLSALGSNDDLWLGSVQYSRPLGGNGLRGQLGYAHTQYELGKEFAVLDASGKAKVSSIGLSYPLLRSQSSNIGLSALYQHKRLSDRQDAIDNSDSKRSDVTPISLSFDHRDGFAGGGITYGALTWSHGRLRLSSDLRAIDDISARTSGSFNKMNLDVARLQALPGNFSLYARASGQWAGKNLDSSESFGLGGPNGVRAYPVGESFGDEGWLLQTELRYSLNKLMPYVFYDSGSVEINANPRPGAEKDSESRSGAGVGVRWAQWGWHLDAAVAWRVAGGEPTSDTRDRNPLTWVRLAYSF